MALIHCPDCGAQLSESAVVCPQCGFPLRRDVLAQASGAGGGGGSRSATNTAAIVIAGVVVAGFVGVVVIGILAALIIPRLTQAAGRTSDAEGETLLRQLYDAEFQYYTSNGRYTADLGELPAGWQPDSARYYHLEVRLGDSPRTLVCLEARPKPGVDARPMSMDSMAVSYRNAGCTGETMLEFRSRNDVVLPPEELPGEADDAGARTMLREVYQGLAEYRAAHGGDPARLGEVLGHVHDSPASRRYQLKMSHAGGLCVSAVPRWLEAPGVIHELSLDGDGRIYAGAVCRGTPLEQVDATLPDSTAAGG